MADGTFLLGGATILDATGADPYRGSSVLVGDGHIRAIGEPTSSDATAIDLTGLTLLPGLIDAHAHHGIVEVHDADRIPLAVLAARIVANLGRTLQEGFTTSREMGGLDGGFAQAVAEGMVSGPRLFPSGPLLCTTAGHGDLGPSYLPHSAHSHDRVPVLHQTGRSTGPTPFAVPLAKRSATGPRS